jgi:hypothetical protein
MQQEEGVMLKRATVVVFAVLLVVCATSASAECELESPEPYQCAECYAAVLSFCSMLTQGSIECAEELMAASGEDGCLDLAGVAVDFSTVEDIPIYSIHTPRTYTYHFTRSSSGTVLLTVLNGADSERLSRARVKVNGDVILDWDQITTGSGYQWLEESITVQSGNNSVDVENDSATAAFFTVFVTDESIVP